MRISKDEITIRSAGMDDAPLLNRWWNDGRVMAHAGFPNGLGEPLERTRDLVALNEQGLDQRCLIEIDAVPVGECSYSVYDGEVEIGIKICEAEYQNRGYGTRILRLLIEFLFTDEAINRPRPVVRVFLDTNLNNTRAQHVYEKLGFVRTGVRVDSWVDQLGQPQSAVDYELRREVFFQS